MSSSLHEFGLNSLDGKPVSLADYAGKAVLVVNVASKCGLTPQYAELQELYDRLKPKGLEILGFPANDFGAQEPGSPEEIQEFCQRNYGVSFPMFEKISVKGEAAHPLYQFLKDATKSGEVQWNFQKYLVNKQGKPVAWFKPQQSVLDEEVQDRIAREL
ncbi:MAG: glutathione peroxidase [Bacteroidetes bacterium]|nr:glutathione peroxidase [Bacteroidota bacterium]